MGCDIHLYIEYKGKDSEYGYRPFAPRINPGRDYLMFAHLADVRNPSDWNPPIVPIAEPRGLPEQLGWHAQTDAYLIIDDEAKDEDGFCSRAKAEEWVKYGSTIIETDNRSPRVTHPDWHSHTWLTPSEFELAIKKVEEYPGGYVDDAYHAVLAAMKVLESKDNLVRAVIWFDN